MEERERSYSFTLQGLNRFLNTVDDPAFQKQDAEQIIVALRDQMRVVPFGEYLKRYVYLRSGMIGSFREIPPEEFRDTVCDAFLSTGTPVSMKHLSTRISAKAGRWLQQDQVRREAVLLMGFGLSMSEEDVNEFLTKALHEYRLDEDDPMEAVCGYCYRHGYGFSKMQQLMQALRDSEAGQPPKLLTEHNQPSGREASRKVAEEDEELIRTILAGKKAHPGSRRRERTRAAFLCLYHRAMDAIGREAEDQKAGEPASKEREEKHGDIERVLYASVPREKHGNLLPLTHSALQAVMASKRLSRQRLSRLTRGEEEPTRYDLMTLSFLICAKTENQTDPRERFFRFTEETNRELKACGFGELYPADPYECFLMMCVLSVEPLGTFGDVLEMSFAGRDAEKGELRT